VTAYLYPDEDAKLLATPAQKVPLTHRVLYGFLAREGVRLGEALSLRWKDVDLTRGGITLDENKTDDPRAWALSPGVAPALEAFKPSAAEPDWLVFGGIEENRAAETFREHLGKAEITRAELFADTAARRPVRVHDLRVTFVTLSLSNGKTEAWVQDRTGHRSSVMINRYRRQARQANELGLGNLVPLVDAIPELRSRAEELRRLRETQGGPENSEGVGHRVGQEAGLEIPSNEKSSRFDAVSGDGIEPPTRGFSILCSTD
jgi:integrase